MEIENVNPVPENPEIEQAPVKKPYPSLKAAFGLIGIFVLISFAIAIPLGILQQTADPSLKSMIMAIAYGVSMLVLLLVGIQFRRSIRFSFRGFPFSIFLMLIPLVISLSILIEPIINLIPVPENIRQLFDSMISDDIYSFLTVVIAAPIFEELIFRGIILDGFLKRYSPLKAIIWSSIFFGISHFNPWQFIAAFSIGLVIGWLYYKTRSLLPGMIIHFINNLMGFMMTFYSGDSTSGFNTMISNHELYLVLFGMSIPVFILLLVLINRRLKQKENGIQEEAVAE